MIKRTILSALTLLAATAPSFAGETKTEGRLVAEITFASIDEAGKGYVDMGDMERFRSSVFAGMDADDSGKVNYEEFQTWDPGFREVAVNKGKPEAYTTATKIVFSFWDRNGDGALTESEMRYATFSDFERADIDGNSVLSEAEFLNGFGIVVAFRASIRPDY